MLIDFCHHSVGSAIKTDKVSFDGYEIQNLISSNPRLKNQGFMSDHFVKPPVNISVQFPCSVSLYRIVIDPVIGRQQSNDIKIFTACNKVEDTWLYGGKNDSVQTDGVLFNQVAFVRETNPYLTCLQSKVFKPTRLWSIDNNQSCAHYKETGELRSSKPGALSNVSHVNICVLRTKSGSSAAIKRLEIWGIPSVTVPKEIQDRLRNSFLDAVRPSAKTNLKDQTSEKGDNSKSEMRDLDIYCDNIQDEIVVPDDFKDQITFEIMACPILLPSGKNIDQTSLDKFVNTEASWGRPPSDPFTGLEFTQGRQPISNMALKSRIDGYTFKHSDKLMVPKTLGRLNKQTKTITSSRLTDIDSESEKQIKSFPICQQSINDGSEIVLKNLSKRSYDRKRKFVNDSMNEKNKYSRQMNNMDNGYQGNKDLRPSFGRHTKPCFTVLNKESTKTDLIHPSIRTETKIPPNTSSVRGHADILTFSLDDALKSALGNLPTFTSQFQQKGDKSKSCGVNATKVIKDSALENNEFTCSKCAIDCKNSDVIKYRLTCKHLICRTCLNSASKDKMICSLCNVHYERDDLVRVF